MPKRIDLKPAKKLSDEALLAYAGRSATRHAKQMVRQRRAEAADLEAIRANRNLARRRPRTEALNASPDGGD